jgi:hypothetical protein
MQDLKLRKQKYIYDKSQVINYWVFIPVMILIGIYTLITSIPRYVRDSTPYVYLVRIGVKKRSIVNVCVTMIRPILEYAIPVWPSIPDHLSQKIDSIQKRALMIIFPETDSYNDALELAKLDTLFNRRVSICQRYMNKMKCSTHTPHFLLPPNPKILVINITL